MPDDSNSNFDFANNLTSMIADGGKGWSKGADTSPSGITPSAPKAPVPAMNAPMASPGTSSILPQNVPMTNGPMGSTGTPTDTRTTTQKWSEGLNMASRTLAGFGKALNPRGPGGRFGQDIIDQQQEDQTKKIQDAEESRKAGYFGIAKAKSDYEMDTQKKYDSDIDNIFRAFGLKPPAPGTFSAVTPQTPRTPLPTPNLQANMGSGLPSAPGQTITPGGMPQGTGSFNDPNRPSIAPPVKANPDYNKENTPESSIIGRATTSPVPSGITPQKSMQERLKSKDPEERRQASLEAEMQIAMAKRDPDALMKVIDKMGGSQQGMVNVPGMGLMPANVAYHYMPELKPKGEPKTDFATFSAGVKDELASNPEFQKDGKPDEGKIDREISKRWKASLIEQAQAKGNIVKQDSFATWTPEAKEQEYTQHLITGKPPVNAAGMGGNDRQAYAKGFAQWKVDNHFSPQDIALMQADYRAGDVSLKNMAKQEAPMEAFVLNINKQVDKVKSLYKNNDRIGIRLLDLPIRELKVKAKGSGDEAIKASYLLEISNEIGKLSSGASGSVQQLSDSAKEDWKKVHDVNLSLNEITKVLNATKDQANMRMSSWKNAKENVRSAISLIGMRDEGSGNAGSGSSRGAMPEVYQKALSDFKTAQTPQEMKAKVKDWVAKGLSKEQINQIGAAIGYGK